MCLHLAAMYSITFSFPFYTLNKSVALFLDAHSIVEKKLDFGMGDQMVLRLCKPRCEGYLHNDKCFVACQTCLHYEHVT